MLNKYKGRPGVLISILGFKEGGAEIMPIRIANYLHARHYNVGVHCLEPEQNESIRKQLNPEIPVHCTHRFWKMGFILWKNKYRVVNTHCIASQLLMTRVRRRIPFLNIYHVATSHGGYEGLEQKEATELLRLVDPCVDRWTYVADNNCRLLREIKVLENKLIKVGNAMERPEHISPVKWSDYSVPEDAIVFTVITRAVWKKCWRETIEAIKKAREITGENIHLVLCGTGPVRDELLQEPQEEFIHFPGTVGNPCDFYSASYCGLLLSRLECAPLGLIEMYYAGVPVIATDTGDVAEMMQYGEERTGILLPLTEDGMIPVDEAAKAIACMIQNPDLYQKVKENAEKKAAFFEMDRIMEQYIQIFER